MLFQAPIYAWFVWVAIREVPIVGMWLPVWIVVAVIVTWPKFPEIVVPGFLAGVRAVWKNKDNINNG